MHRIGRTERCGIWVAALLLLAGCASRTPAPTPSPTPLSPTPTATHTPIPQPEPSPLAPTATTAPELPAGCADPASLPFGFDEFWEQAIPAYFDEGGTPEQLETVLNSLCGTLFGDRPEPVRAQVLTGDLDDAHIKEGLMGATLEIRTVAGRVFSIEYLPKAQARRLYAIAQEMEEEVREERRNRVIEEKRAAAGGVIFQGQLPVAATQGTTESAADDPMQKLKMLKQMNDEGLITAEEFEKKKADILSRI